MHWHMSTMPCTQCRTCRSLHIKTLHISSCCMCPVVILDVPYFQISSVWNGLRDGTMPALCPEVWDSLHLFAGQSCRLGHCASLGSGRARRVRRARVRWWHADRDDRWHRHLALHGSGSGATPEVQREGWKANENENLGLETPFLSDVSVAHDGLILRWKVGPLPFAIPSVRWLADGHCSMCQLCQLLLSLETDCIICIGSVNSVGCLLKADGDVRVSPYWMWNHGLSCPPWHGRMLQEHKASTRRTNSDSSTYRILQLKLLPLMSQDSATNVVGFRHESSSTNGYYSRTIACRFTQ